MKRLILALGLGILLAGAGGVGAIENFSIVVLPDTQYYSSYPDREAIFASQTEWIRENATTRKIKMVLHEGDLVNSNNSAPEWTRAKNAMAGLQNLPYAISLGNHDYSQQKDSTFFNTAFPISNFLGKSWFGGSFEEGKMDNAYYLFEAGEKKWLVLSLEYGPRQAVIDWARRIVISNGDKMVILLTHAYMAPDGTRLGTGDPYNPHNSLSDTHDGEEIWEELVKESPNIVLVFSGHVVDASRRVDLNIFGEKVNQILADYQNDPLGGNGYLRIIEFEPDQKKVRVKTYSPWLNQYKTEDKNQFELGVEWWNYDNNSDKLAGTFLESSKLVSEEQIGQQLDEIKSLGMDTVVLQSMKKLVGGCEGNYEWTANMPGNLRYLFGEAKERNIKVWVGMAMKSPCYEVTDVVVNKKVLADKEVVDLVENEVASMNFNDVMAGYYFSDEPSLSNWSFVEHSYREVRMTADYLKEKNRMSLVSPYLWVDSFNPKTPEWIKEQAVGFVNYTGVDVLAWQDGTGAYATSTDNNNIYHSKKYFMALVKALGKSRIWADIELFNWGSDTDYRHVTSWYRPAVFARIQRQIESAKSTGKQLSWIQQHHMQSVNPVLYFPEAKRLLDGYVAFYKNENGVELVVPTGYSWSVTPNSSYPDSGGEMFDHYPGNPKRYTDGSWVGFLNDDPIVDIDLGEEKRVKWVAVQTLNSVAESIYFPNRMEIECGVKTEVVDLVVDRVNGEMVMQNNAPLGASCRNLRVKFFNDKSWTFLSEIEVVAEEGGGVVFDADANQDGVVDLVDFGIWKTEYLSGVTVRADFNEDMVVDLVDFGIWKNEFLASQ